ncbi:protocadherin-16-like [Dryobates pubescens]|uniref:protocadherin-16-like n=1 Tax=Dryobates pubescens TaxID=118200 RepID=UPI0023BA1917|nr:protocadherin-16-like [Dryobates pubescens]
MRDLPGTTVRPAAEGAGSPVPAHGSDRRRGRDGAPRVRSFVPTAVPLLAFLPLRSAPPGRMGRARRGGCGWLPVLLLLSGAAGLGHGGAARLLRFSGQVPENSPAGTRVRGLQVPLRRLMGPGEPAGEWALEGDGASRFFLQLRPGGGQGLLLLRTAERLDREAQPEYGLWLRRRTGQFLREALLRVRVLDRNDHRPRLPPVRPLEVDELAPLLTEVARFRASDSDEGANARLTYRPWPPGAGSRQLFVVPRSGQVLTVGSLLGLRRLRLCVVVQDHGRPRPLRSPARCLRLAVRGRRAEDGGGAGRRRRERSLLPPERPPGPGSRSYVARLPPGARVGDTVFTIPQSRDWAAGGWFELASPGASAVGVDRTSGRLYLRRELRAGGRAEVLVKVHSGGGRGTDEHIGDRDLIALCRVVRNFLPPQVHFVRERRRCPWAVSPQSSSRIPQLSESLLRLSRVGAVLGVIMTVERNNALVETSPTL